MLKLKQWSWDIRSEAARLPTPEYVHRIAQQDPLPIEIHINYIIFLGYFHFYVFSNG